MLKLEKTLPPHVGTHILRLGSSLEHAEAAMVLLHGRGATAASMSGFTDEIKTHDMAFIIPQAENNAWYPYRFIEKREVNEPEITSGLTLIDAIIKGINQSGIPNERIFLLGFSQGACLAADYTARFPARYGGLFVLSGGLIGDVIDAEDYPGDLAGTPVFLGCSDSDFHIPAKRVHESAAIFESMNADVTKRIYPGMGHTINADELAYIQKILDNPHNPGQSVRAS